MRQRRHTITIRPKSRSDVFPKLALRLSILLVLQLPIAGLADDGGAGQALQAVAGAISAAAPAVEQAIQAAADVDIAKTNAASGLAQTQVTADTSKYLADRQSDIAMYQAETAQAINQINQDGQTRRLEDQLSELHAAREDALQAEREKMAYEKQLNDEKIELAKKQAADNFKLAQETLNAQLVQAGLSSGFTTFNSGNRLRTTYPGQGAGPALASLGGPFAQRSRRLLSSAKNQAGMGTADSQTGNTRGLWASRGPASETVGGQMKQLLANNIAGGSSPGLHRRLQAISDVPRSDLSSFHAAVQTASPVPEESLRTGSGHHHGGSPMANSTHAGASNASSEEIQVHSIGR